MEKHRNTVEFAVYGNWRLFSDPIYRVGGEKCTYPVPTYEALKGILASVYWKPTIIWVIDRVRVINPIQNQVKGIRPIKYSNGGNDLSYYTYLKNVYYQVRAHFVLNENRPELIEEEIQNMSRNGKTAARQDVENKHHNIAKRMIEKGGRRDIFLGTRECQGYVEPCDFGRGAGAYDNFEKWDFGIMYHGITYRDEAYSRRTKGKMTVRLAHIEMKNGIIEFPAPEDCKIERPIKEMDIKAFGGKHNNFTGLAEFGEVE